MNLIQCLQRNSRCYKNTSTGTPVGILWHDTGAGNPELRRYVQPMESDSNYESMIALLGKNQYNNDWNHIEVSAGLNAWIGKLANGKVATIQSMPWNYRPWGCASGNVGSCNGLSDGRFWIQFEICDDFYKDETYFNAVYKEACELTAYLCKMYSINPKGNVSYKGINVPTILCHQDAYRLGMGSNHSDVYDWFNKFGKTIDDVRNDVAALITNQNADISQGSAAVLKVGDLVGLTSDALYYTGKKIPTWVKSTKWYIKDISGDRVVIDKSDDGKFAINSPVDIKYIVSFNAPVVLESGNIYVEPNKQLDVSLNILEQNTYGEQVRRIQQLLNIEGYNCGVADGMLGNKTVAAIKQFQSDNSLIINGIIDEATWKKILTGK